MALLRRRAVLPLAMPLLVFAGALPALMGPALAAQEQAVSAAQPLPDPGAGSPLPPEAAVLDQTAGRIQAILGGSLPQGFAVQTLFEVDLLDEPAVQRRREALEQTLREREAVLATAGAAEAEILRRRIQVDRLRLAFLSRSLEERALVNQAERLRRRISRERQAAEVAREAAATAAEDAAASQLSATSDARSAQSPQRQEIANERARAQAFRADLAAYAADLTRRREAHAAAAAAALQEALALEKRLDQAGDGSAELSRLLAEVFAHLEGAVSDLTAALDTRLAPSTVPSFAAAMELATHPAGGGDPGAAADAAALASLYGEIAREQERLRQEEAEVRWQAVDDAADEVAIMDSLRLRALPRLPSPAHDRVLGLGREGLAHLRLEIQMGLQRVRLHAARRLHDYEQLPGRMRDIFQITAATGVLIKLVLVLGLAVWIRRRQRRWRELARERLLVRARDVAATRRRQALWRWVQALAPGAGVLLFLAALRWALGPAAAWPEIAVVLHVGLWYGAYRLALGVATTLAAITAWRAQLDVDLSPAGRVPRAIRRVSQVIFVLVVVLDLCHLFLGKGWIAASVRILGWAVLLLTAAILLHVWREHIARTYLQAAPAGALSRLVERSRGRWYGFFPGALACLWLTGRSVLALLREFAMGFDQVRRTLAFLFRRRIEKQAERQGYSDGVVAELPPALLECFAEAPLRDEELAVAHFPGLERLHENIRAWQADGAGGSFLLVGDRGMGKTSWLGRIAPDGLPVARCELADRVLTPADLARALGPALGLEEGANGDLEGLATALRDGEPRVVVVDVCQNLFLATVGGYAAFEAFAGLVDTTRSRVYWVCAVNDHAWHHLESVRPDLAVFRRAQELEPWKEEDIRALIQTRMQASGVKLTFEDLLVRPMEGVSTRAQLLETREGYIRLLWDYSDGCPRVALHFWLRSLVPESDNRVRVRLFREPDVDALEGLGETKLFLLSSVMLHENITTTEVAASTGYPAPICRMSLDLLAEMGILRVDRRRYRVATHWQRAVVRFLRRRNLLAD